MARSGDAPEVDRVTLLRELRAALARQQSRIDRCARAVRMDEDPLRARTRVLVGSVTFARSGRASDVRVERSQGIPAPAEACVIEAVSGLSLSTAPRGTVTFAFTYSVR